MARENTLKKYLVKIMGTRWHVQSHEDKHSVGIPDLSFAVDGVNGWIELKHVLIAESKLAGNPIIKPAKFTPSQVNWLNKRGKKGGYCYVLVKVGSEHYYLFHFSVAREIREGRSLGWYDKTSLMKSVGAVAPEKLTKHLKKG